jgi:hypothetical protein
LETHGTFSQKACSFDGRNRCGRQYVRREPTPDEFRCGCEQAIDRSIEKSSQREAIVSVLSEMVDKYLEACKVKIKVSTGLDFEEAVVPFAMILSPDVQKVFEKAKRIQNAHNQTVTVADNELREMHEKAAKDNDEGKALQSVLTKTEEVICSLISF